MPTKKRVVWTLRLILIPVAIACVVVFPPWDGVWLWLKPLPDSVEAEVAGAVEYGLDGVVVFVDQGGHEPGFHAAGWKDRVQQVPADPHALFKIASISKLYVAAASTQVVAEGKLALDTTLAEGLPALADRIEHADQITLRMLLQHRSGIPNYSEHATFDWAQPPPTTDACLALILDQPADFAPDAQTRYSNTNYLLIGRMLDAALGFPHQQWIAERILTPLGLTHTFSTLSQVDGAAVFSGYHHGYEADFRAVESVSPSGSMVATAEDVGTFVRALNDGSLLTEAEQAIYSATYEFGHTGWLLGYQSIARFHPDLDAVVVLFANTTGGDSELVVRVLYNRIVQILHD